MGKEGEQLQVKQDLNIPFHDFRMFNGNNENNESQEFPGEPGGMATAKRMVKLFPNFHSMRVSKIVTTQATAINYIDRMEAYTRKVEEGDADALAVADFTSPLLPLPEDTEQNLPEKQAVIVARTALSALLYSNMLRLKSPAKEFLDEGRKKAFEEAIVKAVASYPDAQSYTLKEYSEDPTFEGDTRSVTKTVSSNSAATRVLATVLMHDFNRVNLTAEPRTLEDNVVDMGTGMVEASKKVVEAVRQRFSSTH